MNGNVAAALQQNNGPIAIVGLGVVASVLGKYLRIANRADLAINFHSNDASR